MVKLQLAHVWSNDRVLAQDKIFSKVDFLQSVVKEENDERMNEQTSSSYVSGHVGFLQLSLVTLSMGCHLK